MNARSMITGLLASAMIFGLGARAQEVSSADEHADRHQHESASSEKTSAPNASTTDAVDAMASEREHVAPQPPTHPMEAMPYRPMARMMRMDDTEMLGKVLIDQFEWRKAEDTDVGTWEVQAWYGGDYNKLWFKTEGERRDGLIEEARVEVLWDRIFARWWSLQTGLREDLGEGPSRTWAAVGLEGLAPYWFDIEATLYLGDAGRTAARFKAEYDLLFTQRLILQPEAEINLYGRDDVEKGIGAGLSDLAVGLRLRYEIRREFAPYVGVSWTRRFGKSADLAHAAGEDPNDVGVLAGLRLWF